MLIQGLVHENTERMLKEYQDKYSIVVSTWDNESSQALKKKFPEINFIIEKLPDARYCFNLGNCYYQMASLFNGLAGIKTRYTLKFRSDEYFSNIDIILKKFNGKRLLCSNIFFRTCTQNHYYHISDHFFIGETDILQQTFQAMESYHRNNLDFHGILSNAIAVEQRIGLFYIAKKEGLNIDYLMSRRDNVLFTYYVMKKYFDVIDVEELKPYIISWNNNPTGVYKIENFRELCKSVSFNYVSSMKDIKPSFKSIRKSLLKIILSKLIP